MGLFIFKIGPSNVIISLCFGETILVLGLMRVIQVISDECVYAH